MYRIIVLVWLLGSGIQLNAQQLDIDWEAFMRRNDMVFDSLTTNWEQGVFTGNGLLGGMLYMEDSNRIRLDIGRTDVTDDRRENMSPLFRNARLPIGRFVLTPSGRVLHSSARLDLWNATANGLLITDKGKIKWSFKTLSVPNVVVFETSTVDGEEQCNWEFIAEKSESPRALFNYVTDKPVGYENNPPGKSSQEEGIHYFRQPLLAGGDYVTAWTMLQKPGKQVYVMSVAINRSLTALPDALNTLKEAAAGKLEQFNNNHKAWWHSYYKQSFLSLPDARMESFYWIQMYKLASATRADKPPMDLMGPWYRVTPWPAYWLNLNIQLSYSPLYTANRLGLAEGLNKMLMNAQQNLELNVPAPLRKQAMAVGRAASIKLLAPVKVQPILDSTAAPADLELGNLTWMLHYFWLHYQYTLEDSVKQQLYPLLKKSINYYLQVMTKDALGKWHLPYTYSPEYPGGITRDCNYDLALFRWGCKTLLELNSADPLAEKWSDVLANITPYPTDEFGFRIGQDIGFNQSHRHYSHLLMIYPLHLVNWEDRVNRPLIERSLNRWHSFRNALQGYSFTGGAAIYATMGNGDKAVAYLNQLFDAYIKPNTMYLESGPVIETPLAAAESIHLLLLQSWGNKIRLFPAVPDNWKELSFENLRTQGAFLVSAVRQEGSTRWVKIKSLKGAPCIIQPGIEGPVRVKGKKAKLVKLEEGVYSITLKKGEELVLYSGAKPVHKQAGAVKQEGKANFWGRPKSIVQ
ncbi:glycoside hydrolase family 95-like protein [Flavihumibacter sp. CACIAM 22H1]|uniref:glycosyl hydrolase family 95 catalytic domain-containing protein n=1 Tax=Flavihumibacter sp. CACIAM 22H1 TaxID=1812911 RepID=UPI0007A7E4C8|nr:hypothetical protein [Flavihumibacter sp. CACIAM 22H1]KYP15999.1 MAG: hypothetical protein A1D16_06995 [Flavihumibacter sp. CACIAM 22H1]